MNSVVLIARYMPDLPSTINHNFNISRIHRTGPIRSDGFARAESWNPTEFSTNQPRFPDVLPTPCTRWQLTVADIHELGFGPPDWTVAESWRRLKVEGALFRGIASRKSLFWPRRFNLEVCECLKFLSWKAFLYMWQLPENPSSTD